MQPITFEPRDVVYLFAAVTIMASQRLLIFIVACIVHTFFLVSSWYIHAYKSDETLGSLDAALEEYKWKHPLQKQSHTPASIDQPHTHSEDSPFIGHHPNRIPGYRFNDTQFPTSELCWRREFFSTPGGTFV